MPSPESLLNGINSPAEFLQFLEVLRAEHTEAEQLRQRTPSAFVWGNEPLDWVNSTLPDFLEAMQAWATASELPEQPSWRFVALLLIAAKSYE